MRTSLNRAMRCTAKVVQRWINHLARGEARHHLGWSTPHGSVQEQDARAVRVPKRMRCLDGRDSVCDVDGLLVGAALLNHAMNARAFDHAAQDRYSPMADLVAESFVDRCAQRDMQTELKLKSRQYRHGSELGHRVGQCVVRRRPMISADPAAFS